MTKNDRRAIEKEISRLEDLCLDMVEKKRADYARKISAKLKKLRGKLEEC